MSATSPIGVAVRNVAHSLKIAAHALGYMRQRERFQSDKSDYVRDPRYAVPVSRFGEALPPVKRETVSVLVSANGSRPQEARRIKDRLDRLYEEGQIGDDAYNAGKLFQGEFERCGYDRCRTTNLAGTSGGSIGIEDIYTRSVKARDYVHSTLRILGGPQSLMSMTVCECVGFGRNVKEVTDEKGRSRNFWSGVLLSALQLMGEDYRDMMQGKARRYGTMVGDAAKGLEVPDHGYVIPRENSS